MSGSRSAAREIRLRPPAGLKFFWVDMADGVFNDRFLAPARYREAVHALGPLQFDECFGYAPLLGGGKYRLHTAAMITLCHLLDPGAEFVILETINDCEYKTKDKNHTVQLYLAAPAEDQKRAFGGHSMVGRRFASHAVQQRYNRHLCL